MKEYLLNLYENTPIFDEVPMSFGKAKEPWIKIGGYLLSGSHKDHEKFLKYI